MNIAWQPHSGPQTEALARSEFEILYGGARGGGKTEAGLAWLLRDIAHPKYRFLVIRRNEKDLSDWLDRARMFYAPVGAEIVGRPAVIKFPSGAMGKIGHLKDEGSYEQFMGHEYQRMLLEELTHIPKEERYLRLVASCRSTVDGLKPQVFATTNPGSAGHVWVKKRFVSNGNCKPHFDSISGRSRIFIQAKLTDNPTLMSKDPSYEAYLRSLPEKTRKAWLEGNWDVFEGQFFDSWDQSIHVCEPFTIPSDWARYISVDYGYSAPSAVLWFAVSPQGTTYQYQELYLSGLTFESLRDEICGRSRGQKIECAFVDPALKAKTQGTGIVGLEVLNSNKQNITFWPADNNRANGWGRLREYYRVRSDSKGHPYSWLQIFDTCRETIRTVPELTFDPIKTEDLDTDLDDHCADAQRYFVMGRPMPAVIHAEDKYAKMRPQDAFIHSYKQRLIQEIAQQQQHGDY